MNLWFNPSIEEHGAATLNCEDPKGRVFGEASVTVKVGSEPQVSIAVKGSEVAPEYEGILHAFLDGAKVTVEKGSRSYGFGGNKANPSTLVIDTETGQYFGARIIFYGGDHGRKIEIVRPRFQDFYYKSKANLTPRYCVLPLVGFETDYYPLPELHSHPLAFQPESPIGLSFSLADSRAYLQPLPPLDNLGKSVTSVLIVEIKRPIEDDFNSLRDFFPYELLSALSFATGLQIGVPWIEFRDNEGKLSHRVHAHFGSRASEERGHVFLEGYHRGPNSGLGEFLGRFMSLDDSRRQWVQVAMNLCTSGTPGSSTIDDDLVWVIRGLELFGKNHGVGRFTLKSELGATAVAEVEAAISGACDRLERLKRASRRIGQLGEVRALERIQGRLWNSCNTDADIGLVLAQLVTDAQLADLEVLDREFFPKLFGGKTWARVISDLRQDAIHEGYLEFRTKHDIDVVFRILRHLHDLLARLIFLESSYDALYNPAVGRWSDSVPIRWVTPTTPLWRLGFEE